MAGNRFNGKTAWLTGADTPVGLAVAKALWAEGASLLLSGLEERPAGLAERPGQSLALYPHNPVEDAQAYAALALLASPPDILVTGTRRIDHSSISGGSAALFDTFIDENLTAAWCALKALAGVLGKNRSCVALVLASIHGDKPTGSAPLFSIANGALNMMMREAAQDLGRFGGRVNMLRYGPLQGDDALLQSDEISGIYHSMAHRLSRGTPATPEEIAKAALFLCSDDASFCNGSTLTADGGFVGFYMHGDSPQRWDNGYAGQEGNA